MTPKTRVNEPSRELLLLRAITVQLGEAITMSIATAFSDNRAAGLDRDRAWERLANKIDQFANDDGLGEEL